VKLLTGGDTVTARFLHREYFEYRPRFTPWLAGNHRPRVRDDDDAIWRRIRLVPFTVEITDDERDGGLKARLRDPELAGQAVLNWIVEGCRKYQRCGLGVPQAVRAATQEYREEMDTFGKFLEDRCMLGPGHWVSSACFNRTYRDWCEVHGIDYPLGPKGLAERLRARGCKPKKGNDVRGWTGITVLARGGEVVETSDAMEAGVQ